MRERRAFEEQFPDGLDLISRALKAGHAFATGLKMVADEMPEPVGPSSARPSTNRTSVSRSRCARQPDHARPVARRALLRDRGADQRETGGNLAEILENLAHVVRERFKILRQVRVYTAHGRFTGYGCSRSRRCCASRCPSSTPST